MGAVAVMGVASIYLASLAEHVGVVVATEQLSGMIGFVVLVGTAAMFVRLLLG